MSTHSLSTPIAIFAKLPLEQGLKAETTQYTLRFLCYLTEYRVGKDRKECCYS